MKILLISPRDNVTLDNDIFPRLSLLLMGTILKKRGHNVKIVHQVADRVLEAGDIYRLVKEYSPEVVGITFTTYQTRWARQISEVVKIYNKDILVIGGGPHCTALKEVISEDFKNIDIVCTGEGEGVIQDIVDNTKWEDIKGISYRSHMEDITTAKRELIQDLDILPFPDLSLVDIRRFSGPYPMQRLPAMSIMGSRGCPYHCTFCCKATFGHKVRYHSPEYVVENIRYLYKQGIREVCFEDDQLNINRSWIEAILEGISRSSFHRKVVLRGGLRANKELVDIALLKNMKSAGFWSVFYGVESGNQYMLDRMKKNITLDEIRRAFELTHKADLKVECPFIIGLPGDTEDSIKDNLKLLEQLKPTLVGFARAMPFPGTEFYQEVKATGHMLDGNFDNWSYLTPRVRTDTLDHNQLEEWEKYCNKIVIRYLLKRCIKDPGVLWRTLKSVGPKEVVSKVMRNIK